MTIMKKMRNAFSRNIYSLYRKIFGIRILSIPILTIQTTNACNLDCEFCYNRKTNRSIVRGFMEPALFKKCVDEYRAIGGKVLRFTSGEHLLSPYFCDFIHYCKNAGIKVRFTSNGQLFTKEMVRCIVGSGVVENINISVEGCDRETYEKKRLGGSFDKLVQALSWFKDAISQTKSNLRIRIQSVIMDEEDNDKYLAHFIYTWKEYCDDFNFMKVGSQSGNYMNRNFTKYMRDTRDVCEHFFETMTVRYNGKVTACCADWKDKLIIGNIRSETLNEIWNSKRLNDMRALARKKKYQDISSACVNCTNITKAYRDECDGLARRCAWIKNKSDKRNHNG